MPQDVIDELQDVINRANELKQRYLDQKRSELLQQLGTSLEFAIPLEPASKKDIEDEGRVYSWPGNQQKQRARDQYRELFLPAEPEPTDMTIIQEI